jgi:myo-inositol-1(or 4)-monophosphatase
MKRKQDMVLSRLEIAKTSAVTVGKGLLDHFYNGDREGDLKPDQTLVTEADKTADIHLQKLIGDAFPADGILSEENSTTYPDTDDVWVLDPLDGTVNFSLGLHYWGVSIAHFQAGHLENSAIYFPVIDELYSASAGNGAEFNGKPLSLSDPPIKTEFPIFVHCSRLYSNYHVSVKYKKRSLGAAAYHLCLVPKGAAILALESQPRIWDFAASWLIVNEAGGMICTIGDEEPFPARVGIDYADLPFPILAAADQNSMAYAIKNIQRRNRSKE